MTWLYLRIICGCNTDVAEKHLLPLSLNKLGVPIFRPSVSSIPSTSIRRGPFTSEELAQMSESEQVKVVGTHLFSDFLIIKLIDFILFFLPVIEILRI